MISVNRQILEAIWVISHRRAVFTVADVAAYANLQGAEKSICEVLRRQCDELLNLDLPLSAETCEYRYIRKINVEMWWVRQTLRWVNFGIDYLTERQLSLTMSLAFDECRWSTPPEAILQVGYRWAMVSEGCVPGTYVFPWASVLRTNPQIAEAFLSILDPQSEVIRLKNDLDDSYQQYQWQRLREDDTPVQLGQSAIIAATDEVLNTLSERQSDVIRCRYGFDTGHKVVLEELGSKFGVTRERVRQIEKKALKKLKNLPACHYGFVVHFILSGGSLLIPESEITPRWKLLSQSIELKTVSIPELGLRVLGGIYGFPGYLKHLDSDDACADITDEKSCNRIFEELRFLPGQDAISLCAAEQEYRDRQKSYRDQESIRTLPRMALQSLRSIGRAAHYQEIAEECNRMFPENQTSIRNWHAVLCRPDSLELGIVWIGKRGMYGLEEHGYSRPTRDLFEAVTSIVEARFSDTRQPVSYDFVMRELSKERQDPEPASVSIALSLNDRLESMGHGRYVPVAHASPTPSDTAASPYDFDAGFDAFLAGDDEG